MPILEMNPQEFAKNLAQQANNYVPAHVTEDHKKYITKKVYEFCFITGDHLLKQYKDQFSDDQASIIIQFIGEWTFHKAMDMMTAGIRNEFWDTILQQVAFAALTAALEAFSEKKDQQTTAGLIEAKVMEAYKQCLDHLIKANAIKQEDLPEILAHSNVDKMAQESTQADSVAFEDDEKTLKLLAIALVLKKMPESKANKILQRMSETEQQRILSCMQITDLESKVDPEIINQYISDLKKNIATHSKPKPNEMVKSFKKLQEKYGEEEIINLTMFERSKVQEFLSSCLLEDGENVTEIELSAHIIKILYSYLKNKLAA